MLERGDAEPEGDRMHPNRQDFSFRQFLGFHVGRRGTVREPP